MAARNDIVRARVRHQDKLHAQEVLDKLGLSMSDVINMLLVQIHHQQGLPFEVKIPNAATQQVMADTDAGKNLVSFDSVDELMQDLTDDKSE